MNFIKYKKITDSKFNKFKLIHNIYKRMQWNKIDAPIKRIIFNNNIDIESLRFVINVLNKCENKYISTDSEYDGVHNPIRIKISSNKDGSFYVHIYTTTYNKITGPYSIKFTLSKGEKVEDVMIVIVYYDYDNRCPSIRSSTIGKINKYISSNSCKEYIKQIDYEIRNMIYKVHKYYFFTQYDS